MICIILSRYPSLQDHALIEIEARLQVLLLPPHQRWQDHDTTG